MGGCQESNLKMLPGSKRGDRGMGGEGRGGHRAGRGHRDGQRRRTRGGENVCLQFTRRRVSEMIRTSLRPWSLHRERVNVSCLWHGDNLRTLQHPAETDTQSNTLSHIFLSGESADSCTTQQSTRYKNRNNKTPVLIFLIVGGCQHSHRLHGECHSNATQANRIIYTRRQSI